MLSSTKLLILFACSTSFLVGLSAAHRTPSRQPFPGSLHVPAHEQGAFFTRDTSGTENITILDGITYFNGTSYWAVTCVYSVSGVYTRFQRILFYAALAFTFAIRFHEWLTAVGVAFVVTYSSTTAIHAIALTTQPNIGTDLDQVAVWAVLQPAVLGGVAFALYAPHIINTNPTYMFLSWTLLLTLAAALLEANNARFLRGYGSSAVMVACDMYGNCNDTCQSGINNVLFRTSYDQMVPNYLGPWANSTHNNITAGDASVGLSYMEPRISSYLRSLMFGLLLGIVLRTNLTCLDHPPRVLRDQMFRLFSSRRTAKQCEFSKKRFLVAQSLLALYHVWQALIWGIFPLILLDILASTIISILDKHESRKFIFKCTGLRPRGPVSRSRLLVARVLALTWYVWTCMAYLVWPAAFIYHIVDNERSLDGISESERLQAVGQWGPWVGVALAFVGACLNKLLDLPLVEREKEVIYLNEMGMESPDNARLSERAIQHRFWVYVKYSGIVVLLAKEWQLLKIWWKDPMEVSWESELADTVSNQKNVDDSEKELDERPLLAWCSLEEEEIGYDIVLNRMSNTEREMKQPCLKRWSTPEGEAGVASQPSNQTTALWPLNAHYEYQDEDEDEIKS